MKKVNGHYSKEFKIKAVELSNQRGSIVSVAAELNIGKETLRYWKKSYNLGKLQNENVPLKLISPAQEELYRLKKELYETKLERDILKKALSIFSKSDK